MDLSSIEIIRSTKKVSIFTQIEKEIIGFITSGNQKVKMLTRETMSRVLKNLNQKRIHRESFLRHNQTTCFCVQGCVHERCLDVSGNFWVLCFLLILFSSSKREEGKIRRKRIIEIEALGTREREREKRNDVV